MPQFEHERRQGDTGKVSPACAGFAQFVKFGMERRPRLLSDVLQFAEQVLVGFSAAVDKPTFGIAVLPTLSDGIGEPLTDFGRAGLVVLAVKVRVVPVKSGSPYFP